MSSIIIESGKTAKIDIVCNIPKVLSDLISEIGKIIKTTA